MRTKWIRHLEKWQPNEQKYFSFTTFSFMSSLKIKKKNSRKTYFLHLDTHQFISTKKNYVHNDCKRVHTHLLRFFLFVFFVLLNSFFFFYFFFQFTAFAWMKFMFRYFERMPRDQNNILNDIKMHIMFCSFRETGNKWT